MTTKEFFQSFQFKILLGCVGGLIVLLLTFHLGTLVGFHKARFALDWGDNYHRNFGGPRGGFLRDFTSRDYMNGHGTAGTVVRIDGQSVVVKDGEGVEKIATVGEKTSIMRGRSTVALSDIKPDEQVVVIGTPKEDGTIDAKIIRLFPMGQSRLPAAPMMHS